MIELISVAKESERRAIHKHEEFLKDVFAEIVYRMINNHSGSPCSLCEYQDTCLYKKDLFTHHKDFPKDCAISIINSVMSAIAQEKKHYVSASDPFIKTLLISQAQ